MPHKLISLTIVALLFACGEHKSKKRPADPVAPNTTNTQTPPGLPNLSNKQFTAVRANFKGSYIGVVDGQLYNFDAAQNPGEPLQFVFANVKDASETMLAALERRPQRIDVVNEDYVLLQRPHYQYYSKSNYQQVNLAQDCYLINIKNGAMWKFDEFFPVLNTLQVVQSGSSKKLLFVGRKKAAEGSNSWMSLDLKKDYNYDASAESGYSMSMPASSPKVLVSIDFSDSQQVTLRPISSGLDNIASYLTDANGNVLAQTEYTTASTQPRVLAILQNEQTPVEVTINNANMSQNSYDNRIVLDSKDNFWRFSRQSNSTVSGYTIKAERLILARDLDNRPALMPLATVTQTISNYSFRFDGLTWNGTYKDSELFSFTGLLAVTDPAATRLQLINDAALASGFLKQTMAAVDTTNGKVLSYLEAYSNGSPLMMVYDVADAAAGKASIIAPESKSIYGALKSLTARKDGGFDLETLDGPQANLYIYDSVAAQAALVESIRLETDNRVRVLVPVTAIP
jgi:hypothetical protein